MTDVAELADEIARLRTIEQAAVDVAEHAGACANALSAAQYDDQHHTFLLPAGVRLDHERTVLAMETLERAFDSL